MTGHADSHVLIVEDDPDASANLVDILELDGYTCDLASSIKECLRRLDAESYGTIILDRRLPDGQSIDSLPEIRRFAPGAAIIVVTGNSDLEGAIQALRCGASDYILKPVYADALRTTLQRLRQTRAKELEIERLNRDLSRRQAELDSLLTVFPSDFAIAIADDPSCEVWHVSDAFNRMLGLPSGSSTLDLQEREQSSYYFAAGGKRLALEQLPVQQAAQHGEVTRGAELDVVRHDGTEVHLLCYSSPLYDEHGKPRGAIGAFLDVTERRKAAQALEKSERRFRAIFDNSMDGLIVMDDAARIVDANLAAGESLGRTVEELKGKGLAEALSCSDPDGAEVHWRSVVVSGRATGECQARDRHGRIIDMEYRAAANFLPGLHVISIRDVTERKRAEQRLLQSERLAAIGATVAGLAHESRNALQRSRACLELLSLEIADRPEAADLVERVTRAQNRLQELYEEVREYAAPIMLDLRPADVRQVWRNAWNHVTEAHPEKNLDLVEEAETEHFRCSADPHRLEQVFLNIFENAHQVAPQNSVVRVHCKAGSLGEHPAIQIAIEDSGPGMSGEQRNRIFEAFFTTKTRGTGLGMAIVQRIVHAHGGRISVADRDGPGATINILLKTLDARRR